MVMKNLRLLLVLTLLLTAGAVKANHEFSTLLFHQRDYLPVVVELDYVPASSYPQTEYTFRNLEPGRHFLKAFRMNGSYYHPYRELLYSGFVDVPAASMVTAQLNGNCLRVLSVIPLPVCSSPVAYQPAPVDNAPLPACTGMNPRRFEALRAAIAARTFDSTRLKLARQAVREHSLNSDQVAALTALLNFDSSRLELAKYAYRYVADPENYYRLYDLFAFDSSVRELSDYIERFG